MCQNLKKALNSYLLLHQEPLTPTPHLTPNPHTSLPSVGLSSVCTDTIYMQLSWQLKKKQKNMTITDVSHAPPFDVGLC